jgi:hypothetical protein
MDPFKCASKIKLLLLSSNTLKVLAIHGAGQSIIDSIWHVERKFGKFCNLTEEYTKRLIYAKAVWSHVEEKTVRTIFCERYFSSADDQMEGVGEIRQLQNVLIKQLRSDLKENRQTYLMNAFKRYFCDSPSKQGEKFPLNKKALKRKVTNVNSRLQAEANNALYQANNEAIDIYSNLTDAMRNMLNHIHTTQDVDFLFHKTFSLDFSACLVQSDKRDILYIELIYLLLFHRNNNNNLEKLNKMIKLLYLSYVIDSDTESSCPTTEMVNHVITKRSCPIKCLPLLRSRDDYRHSTSSILPKVKRLERLLKSQSHFDDHHTFELIDLTRSFCTYKIGHRRGRFIVDGDRQTFLQNISPENCNTIYRAVKTASSFEVMRPFHISPCIAFSLGNRDIQLACLLLIMLSSVHNILFVPEMDVESNLVVLTPSAKGKYVYSSIDTHVTINTKDSIIISEEILSGIIESIIASEDFKL